MASQKILLVDDEPSIRFVLSAVLEQAGYAVAVAEDGFAALSKMQDFEPHLVITDLRMPNMNGFELLSVIRTRHPEMPTIAISGEFQAATVEDGPLADAFFQKGSYAIPDLLSRIAALLSAPVQRKLHKKAPLWAPTGSEPVMLTCTNCLRSFPIEACENNTPSRTAKCIFCGAELEVQMIAIGVAPRQAQ